ncbi:MAG: hypothetical protein LLG20_09170 [Acidobacteriales bacterium]|nr:hypothetical protein [Terriglobales bacterium]
MGAPSQPAESGVWNRIIRSPGRAFILIFLLGFTIRGAVLVSGLLPSSYFRPRGEIGKVAVTLARTGQFANPYMIPTGATAHPTPVYTGLLALVYRSIGVTPTANYVRGLLAILAFSALYAMLPWLGLQLGLGARAGILGGIAGALVPQQGILEIIGNSDQPFPGIALGLLAVAFLRRWSGGPASAARSFLLGIGCGAAFHLSPPLLPVVLGWLLFEIGWSRARTNWRSTACIVLGVVLVCIPWTWRNYAAFHRLLFIRGNFGLELRLANHDGADADIDVTVAREAAFRHPSANIEEARKVRDLGEGEYMRQARNEAVEWIYRHPRGFLRLTFLRAVQFWCGPVRLPWSAAAITVVTALALLGLRRALSGLDRARRAAVLMPLLLFPLVYYVVSFVGHYRAPLEGWLLLLAGVEVSHRFERAG